MISKHSALQVFRFLSIAVTKINVDPQRHEFHGEGVGKKFIVLDLRDTDTLSIDVRDLKTGITLGGSIVQNPSQIAFLEDGDKGDDPSTPHRHVVISCPFGKIHVSKFGVHAELVDNTLPQMESL